MVIFVIRDLRAADREVQRIYAGSVLGLRGIGELQYQAQETRRSTLYALTTNDSNLQVEYADQSRAADRRVSDGITDYLAHARMPREVDVGQRLERDWSADRKSATRCWLRFWKEALKKRSISISPAACLPSIAFARIWRM